MDSVFLNGTVGVGKSTVADAVAAGERGPCAVVDLDQVRRLRPAPAGDPFAHEVELRNLRDLARNYREAGARRFVLAGVIERPEEVARYLDALGGGGMLVCRLHASPVEIDRRLRARHAADPAGLDWHLGRAAELAAILDAAALDDLVIDTTGVLPDAVARSVRRAAGWG